MRLAGEIILALLVLVSVIAEGAEMYESYKEKGSFAHFFTGGWVYVDLASEALFVSTIVIWWITILQHTRKFSPELRYNVYYDLLTPANFIRLNDGGSDLVALAQMFVDVQEIASLYQVHPHSLTIHIDTLCLVTLLT